MSETKRDVYIDIDDVKTKSKIQIVRIINRDFKLKRTVDDWERCGEDLVAATGTSREVINDWWPDAWAETIPELEPDEEFREVLVDYAAEFGSYYDLTSRREVHREPTERWNAEHYPGLVDGVHMAGIDWANGRNPHLQTKVADLKRLTKPGDLYKENELKHALPAAVEDESLLVVRYCQSEHAKRFQAYPNGPPNYHEAVGVSQLREFIETKVLPLAALATSVRMGE